MGATQSIAGAPLEDLNKPEARPSAVIGSEGRPPRTPRPDMVPPPFNNRATVKALLMTRLSQGEEPTLAVHPYYQPWVRTATPSNSPSNSNVPRSPPQCPMHDSKESRPSTSSSPTTASKLNPLNMLPILSQNPSANQKAILSTERTTSSIPRSLDSASSGASPYERPSACPVPHDQRASVVGKAEEGKAEAEADQMRWEYPSPQQFYNALVRKGWETPEEHVEMMVLVHNFLNERAWTEVMEWEREMGSDPEKLSLARFQGRPGTLSPKARLFSWAAAVAPSQFSSEPPFDRHDWVIRRPVLSQTVSNNPAEPLTVAAQDNHHRGGGIPPSSAAVGSSNTGKEVRYVIDYYSGPDDPDRDEPVFFLDVRPALDSPEAAWVRLKRGWKEWTQGERTSETSGAQ